jgi:hypothetical protein
VSGVILTLASPPFIGTTTPNAGGFTTLNISQTATFNGPVIVQNIAASPLVIFDEGATTGSLTINAAANLTGNGASISLIGPGTSLTSKMLRVVGGLFQIVNNSKNVIFQVDDTGNLFTENGIDNTAIGKTTPTSGAFTTLSAVGGLTVLGHLGTAYINTTATYLSLTTPSGEVLRLNDAGFPTTTRLDMSFNVNTNAWVLAALGASGLTLSSSGGGMVNIATAAITGGSINGTVVGALTPATGTFTTLSAGAVSGAGFVALQASPNPVGSVTPNTGAFTTLSANGATTLTGLGFGTTLAAAATTLTNHIALYSNTYGLCVSNGSLNYVIPSGSQHSFLINGVAVGLITSSGLNATAIGASTPATAVFSSVGIGSGGPTWTSGTVAPSTTTPVGSLYSRVGGAIGATLYVSRGGGAWVSVSGV